MEIYRFIESISLPTTLPRIPEIDEKSFDNSYQEIVIPQGIDINPINYFIILFFTGLILFLPFLAWLEILFNLINVCIYRGRVI